MRIDHIGIAVRDLDASVEFYQRVYGFQLVHTEINEEQGVREAMLALGDSGARIQLLSPLRNDSPVGRFIVRSGQGVQQIAFAVDDLDAESARLTGLGLRLVYDEPQLGTAGTRINFIHPRDAGGVLIELVEAAAGGAE